MFASLPITLLSNKTGKDVAEVPGSIAKDFKHELFPDKSAFSATIPLLELPESSTGSSSSLYDALPSKEWFRLLWIEPGGFDADVCVHLRSIRREEGKFKYEALSYCWNQPRWPSEKEPDMEIICNGKRLKVGPNLALALRYIRKATSWRTFWIDAICINQEDNIERAQQVQIMGEIYSQADRTIVWLGLAFH